MPIMVAFPLTPYNVPTPWFSHWLNLDHTAIAGTVVATAGYLTTTMETIVGQALDNEGWDRLLVYEHDMLPPLDAITRMNSYKPEHDIVGSFYFGHNPPHNAFVYIEQDGHYNPITAKTVDDWCADPALYQCSGVGFGFTSIARHVLEDWDPKVPMFALDDKLGSHDLWFCHQARLQNYRVYVDSGICSGHLSQVPVWRADNKRLADTIDYEQIFPFTAEETAASATPLHVTPGQDDDKIDEGQPVDRTLLPHPVTRPSRPAS